MSGVSLPSARPVGRVLVIGSPACRGEPLGILQRLGFGCAEVDDPYAGMVELCRRPLAYRAVIISLASLYREELPLIGSLKRRFPHLETWLSQTDGRQGALAEAMRLGADGLLAEDGLHRIAAGASDDLAVVTEPGNGQPQPQDGAGGAAAGDEEEDGQAEASRHDNDLGMHEPVLTAEELRALLQEQPSAPPSSADE